MKPDTAPQLLKPEEVAHRLGVSCDSVERLIGAGDLRAVDVRAGGARPRLRVSEVELARFIAEREIPTPARVSAVPGPTAIRRRAAS